MESIVDVVAIVAISVLGAALARRLGFVAPLVLLVAGLALSFVPGMPEAHLDPDLVLIGILPPLLYTAALEMHPLDTQDRLADLKQTHGIGFCNITKCCTKVCPEHITITDNAIIPLKERVVDRFYDPISRLLRMFKG